MFTSQPMQRVQAVGSQRRRHGEDSHADDVADHEGGAHPEAEDAPPAGGRLLCRGAAHFSARASVRAASKSIMASSTWARLTLSGGMKRRVLTPQESSSSPLWKARVSTRWRERARRFALAPWRDELRADHEPLAAHVTDAFEALLQGAQPLDEVAADGRGVGRVLAAAPARGLRAPPHSRCGLPP